MALLYGGMTKPKPPRRKPGRPRLGGRIIKVRLREEAYQELHIRAAALSRPAGHLGADAIETWLWPAA